MLISHFYRAHNVIMNSSHQWKEFNSLSNKTIICFECFSDGTRARLRIPVGELNDLAGSRRNLHLRGEQPRWIPGESFLLRERRSLWRRQGPGNYFTIYLCPPVMDYPYLLLLPTTTTTTTTTTITTTALLICACACTSQHCI